ncbi:hypothetical protein BC940DRAFT_331074 [Gongronella butleri]|nr:hypothetical protein BC940DRAFT_331074 [Gongronella butleri]
MASDSKLVSGPAYHEIQGYMPKRREFEVESLNDAEKSVADMVFYGDDTAQDIRLKLMILDIYNTRLDRRIENKRYIFEREWLDFRAQRLQLRKKAKVDKQLFNRARAFSRLQTARDHDAFVQGLIREQELRDRIATLQRWRYHAGITTLQEGEAYEEAKEQRLHHLKSLLAAAHHRLQLNIPTPNEQQAFSSTSTSQQHPLTSVSLGVLPTPSFPLPIQRSASATPASVGLPSLLPSRPLPPTSSIASSASSASSISATLPRQAKRQAAAAVTAAARANNAPPAGRKPANALDISQADGIELLTADEQALCSALRLLPRPYLVIKSTILKEYEKRVDIGGNQ